MYLLWFWFYDSQVKTALNLHIYKFEVTQLHVSDKNLQIPKRFLLENLVLPISFIFFSVAKGEDIVKILFSVLYAL